MGVSNAIFPCPYNFPIAKEVRHFDTEPILNFERVVTGVLFSRSAIPNASAHKTFLRLPTQMEMPGMPRRFFNDLINFDALSIADLCSFD
jgi:hypothetical protein